MQEFVTAVGFLVNEGIIPSPGPKQESARFALADHVHEYSPAGHVHGYIPPHTVQDDVEYDDQYSHYFEHRIGPIADIAVPPDDSKCIDELGEIRTPTIKLKFRQNEYTKSLVEVTGAGIRVDGDDTKRMWYQFFNKTNSVGPVLSVQVFAVGLQVGDTSWIYDMKIGQPYEIRSVYGDQCGRSTMMLGY